MIKKKVIRNIYFVSLSLQTVMHLVALQHTYNVVTLLKTNITLNFFYLIKINQKCILLILKINSEYLEEISYN